MRGKTWILGAAMMAVAGPAAAQGVKLAIGDEVTFTLDSGKPVALRKAPAIPTRFETAVGAHFLGLEPPKAPVTEGQAFPKDLELPAPPVPDAGKIRFRFLGVAGSDHAMLVIQNGYAQALVYRARITARGQAAPTDVCLVMPGKPSIEHWPYAISAIEVSDFTLVPWKPEDGVPCE
ncbi:hypothetical protein HNP52_001093 [Sphingomonas kyeonggiensis]|uniref:Uncharacterized protein n=1 Tax=Sphingomonas kyeonggiensis TaxID=1268553 RepID=A0A7W7JZ34_9SPHN|nr:hypothetical protein [Sphingomonas kyeonggiensis]MBB4838042.1 hypothetical protein [Sphingomonas kyeonggiensis]